MQSLWFTSSTALGACVCFPSELFFVQLTAIDICLLEIRKENGEGDAWLIGTVRDKELDVDVPKDKQNYRSFWCRPA
jgi:hypothetical protein